MRCFTLGAGMSGGATVDSVKQIISNWPEASQKAATATIKKYGVPDDACDSQIMWGPREPWHQIIVYQTPIPHNWPSPHLDVLEQAVNFQYPLDKYDDMVLFDGSVFAERTRGRLAARCGSEPPNFLALNLAYEIATDRRAWQDARMFYERAIANWKKGMTHPYLTGLIFQPSPHFVGDPDTRVM